MKKLSPANEALTRALLADEWAALGGVADIGGNVSFSGEGVLPAPFAVSHLGAAAFGAAGAAVSELIGMTAPAAPEVRVDAELASGWMVNWGGFPVGDWKVQSPWHPTSDHYESSDGRWIRLQANYPHLRRNMLATLDVDEDPLQVAAVIARHPADEVEQALVDGGGAAAASRTLDEWARHPQGAAVAAEPLIDVTMGSPTDDSWAPVPERPLSGIRVLDITRVLAGPVSTRFLAGYGAEVLRLVPPGLVEPTGSGGGHIALGKRCATLDLRTDAGRERFFELLAGADVFVHGLRPGALDNLGLDAATRNAVRPGLVDVTLNAYGWTGPWAGRRGFDTLVQTSSGMSSEVMARHGLPRPELLPAQVMDYATGYLMAAAAVRGLTRRLREGRGSTWRLALARTGAHLLSHSDVPDGPALALPVTGPVDDRVFTSARGPLRRLVVPLEVGGAPHFWERPGDPNGTSTPTWATAATIGRRSA